MNSLLRICTLVGVLNLCSLQVLWIKDELILGRTAVKLSAVIWLAELLTYSPSRTKERLSIVTVSQTKLLENAHLMGLQ